MDNAQVTWGMMTFRECMTALNPYNVQHGPHCPVVHDNVLCWPDTPIGRKAVLPCPPLKGLNPQQYASKQCLTTGQWQAKSNYSACYTPEAKKTLEKLRYQPSETAKARATIELGNKVGMGVQVLSLVCLFLALILLLVLAARSRRLQASRCALLVCALLACCLQHLVQLLHGEITTSMDLGCLLTAALITFTTCAICFSLLANLVLLALRVRRRLVSLADVVIAVVTAILSSAVCTTAWIVTTFKFMPRQPCWNYLFLNVFDWIITVPIFLSLLLSLVLGSALVYRLVCTSDPWLKVIPNFKVIRHSCVLQLFLTAYLLFCEVYNRVYSYVLSSGQFSPPTYFLLVVSFWVKGLVLSLLLCFLDLEILSYCPCSCVTLEDDTAGEEQPLSSWKSMKEGSGQQDQARADTPEVTRVSGLELEVKPMANVQSRLKYGSLGSGR